MKDIQIGVIGLGKLGLPCAEIFSEYYKNVKGYDIKPNTSDKINIVDSLKDVVIDSNFIFIFVPTPHSEDYSGETPAHNLPPRDFDYTAVCSVLKQINECISDTQTVILVSTVLPGTIREQLSPLLTKGEIIYNPYLVAMGTEKTDMAMPECLIFGTKTGALDSRIQDLIEFYRPIIKNDPLINAGTWEEAESIKVFYNTFISFKLSFVNMIQDVAMKQGHTNANFVAEALARSTQRITGPRYMRPGLGDGGPCHPRDNIALRYLSQKLNLEYDIFQGIIESREKQAKSFAKFICQTAKEKNLPIFLHGKTFKRGLSYTQGSYSLLLNFYIELEGQKTQFIDPNTDPLTTPLTEPILLVLTHPVSPQYLPYCDIPRESVIIDPWQTAKDVLSLEILEYGNSRLA